MGGGGSDELRDFTFIGISSGYTVRRIMLICPGGVLARFLDIPPSVNMTDIGLDKVVWLASVLRYSGRYSGDNPG